MKLTKVLICSAVVGILGFNAKAGIPSGFESVNFKATLQAQNGNKVEKMKVTSDDLLGLIDTEYGTSYSKADGGSGFKLVSYGFDDEDFAVLDKNGNVVLANASNHSDNYYLYINPFYDDEWVNTISGNNNQIYGYTIAGVEVTFRSNSETDSFFAEGAATDKVNWDLLNESYNLSNAQGYFDFGSASVSGIVTGGSASGSGKDIVPFDD